MPGTLPGVAKAERAERVGDARHRARPRAAAVERTIEKRRPPSRPLMRWRSALTVIVPRRAPPPRTRRRVVPFDGAQPETCTPVT